MAPLVDSNVLVGTQVAEAMLRAGCRGIVNTGTSWQRDARGAYDPVCLYAATKQAFEDVLTYYVSAEGFAATTLRLYDTYGPDDPRPKLVNALAGALRSGTPLSLSPGEQLLDLVHIDDVTAAFAAAGRRLLDGGAAVTSASTSRRARPARCAPWSKPTARPRDGPCRCAGASAPIGGARS